MKLWISLLLCSALVGCSESYLPLEDQGQRGYAAEGDRPAPDDSEAALNEVARGSEPAEVTEAEEAAEVEPADEALQDAGRPWEPVAQDAGDEPDPQEPVDGAVPPSDCLYDDDHEPVTLTVPTDYATIQQAINAASRLDTVHVLPGTYSEHLQLKTGVRLIGSGADTTILDGLGEGRSLIDFTEANDVVVSGFTLRNVGQANDGCGPGPVDDVLECAGDWYAAAVFADGHTVFQDSNPCNDASLLFSENIVEGNQIGMMVYFGPQVVVRDNVFAENVTAFAANHHGGQTGLVAHNIFYGNDEAMALGASFLDVIDNAFADNGLVLRQEHCQEGRLRCNLLWNNDALGDRWVLGADDNIEADPLLVSSGSGYTFAEGSPAIERACAADPVPLETDGSCTSWEAAE